MRQIRTMAAAVGAAFLLGSMGGIFAAAPVKHINKVTPAKAVETAVVPGQNPLLPRPIPVESFFVDLSLVPKGPVTVAVGGGYEPLFSAAEWAEYEKKFAGEDAGLTRKKSSGQVEFAKSLIAQAKGNTGLDRLLLLRAAIVAYRNRDGFTTADAAVAAYQKIMDIQSVTQMGALWTISNAMSRTISTPRPERIRYDGIAARANMQLTILLLQSDQVATGQALNRMIGYHEGWVRSDKTLTAQIARVRSEVRETTTTMDYLATQYQPAISGDDSALMAIYLYGRFVKNNPAIVADLPGRKPSSPMAQLANTLNAAERGSDPMAMYTAADMLKTVATTLPDGVLKQRTLYAALANYRSFVASPATERERIKRTLARMAIEGVIADGARAGTSVHPFELPSTAPATLPTTTKFAEATTRPGKGAHDTEPTEPVPPGHGTPLKPVPPGTQPTPEPVPPTSPMKPAPLPPGKAPNPSLPGMPSPTEPPTTRPSGEPESPIM